MFKFLIAFVIFFVLCLPALTEEDTARKGLMSRLKNYALNTVKDRAYENMSENSYLEWMPIGFSTSYGLLALNQVNKNNPTNNIGKINSLQAIRFDILVNQSKNWAMGLAIMNADGYTSKKNANSYYFYGTSFFTVLPYLKYKYLINEKFIFDVNLGSGLLFGGYEYIQSDEESINNEIARQGWTMPLFLESNCRFRLNPFWHIGLNLGYLYANINNLGRFGIEDKEAKELDLSGFYMMLNTGINF